MTEQRLHNQVGVFIILANVFVIAETLVFYFAGGFAFDEMTTTVALIVPMFSVYTIAILKSIIGGRRRTVDRSHVIAGQYVFVSWLLPVVFTVLLMTIVALKAYNVGFESFEQFKNLLIASETMFGSYVGVILGSMFRLEQDQRKRVVGQG